MSKIETERRTDAFGPVCFPSLAGALILALALTLPAGLAETSAVYVNRGDNPVGSRPIDGHLSTNGTLLTAVNLGSATIQTHLRGPGDSIPFSGVMGVNPSGSNWFTGGANSIANLEQGGATTDPVFFSEVYGGRVVTVTYENLNPANTYLVQILHGEPRSCCGGIFMKNGFALRLAGGGFGNDVMVPAFQIGNNVAGENPPDRDDLAIVTAEFSGIESFTYLMRGAANNTRSPSIAGFQVRILPGFINVPIDGLPKLSGSSVAWGDYDNDGRLDFLLTGYNGNQPIAQLWRNSLGGFTNVTAAIVPGLPGFSAGSAKWVDYDNDGRLDFLLTGYNGNEPAAQLWRNSLGGFTNVTGAAVPDLQGVVSSSMDWGDYDNDGRLDFIVCGYDGSTDRSQLWRNTGKGFVNETSTVAPGLPGVVNGAVAWGDYDNDGRLDFLLTGLVRTNLMPVSQLWRNTGKGFSKVTADVAPGLPGVFAGSVAWGDYDGDGRLDFILTGSGVSQVWRNTGTRFANVTTTIAPELSGVDQSSVAWGDYDNDGRPDFLLTGWDKDRRIVSQLWRNTGKGFSNVTADVVPGLPGVFYGSVAWGDYDNDGRLDFILSGDTGSGFVSQLWRNTGSGIANSPPSAPKGLTLTSTATAVMLSWNSATDAQTPASSLTYNVRAGTTPGGADLLAAQADVTTGIRWVPASGNAGLRHQLPIAGLTVGSRVFWSVQAVDSAFTGGPFATETSAISLPTLSVATSDAIPVIVSWTPPTWGWVLQESTSLNPEAWSNSFSGENNPARVLATNGLRFYRLVAH